LAQADALSEVLKKKNRDLGFVIEMKVDDEALVKRITGRFNCKECGEVYHKDTKPLKKENFCNSCLATNCFEQRSDDNESSFRTRLTNYYKDTSPLIGYYYAKGLLVSVDGLLDIGAIQKNIIKVLHL
jgi:adenylate kinase